MKLYNKFNNKFDKMHISKLNDDVLYIILKDCKIICHVCNKKYNFKRVFYKKQNKFYYCSRECYEFI